MSAILRGISSRTLPLIRLNGIQKATLVSGPPKNRISMAEKGTFGVVMAACVVAPAGYILAHLDTYKRRD